MGTHDRERESHIPSRREALRTLMLGAGAGLIVAPAGGALALNAPADPLERARGAWIAFSTAMNEMTADANGWLLAGAGVRRVSLHDRPPAAWLQPRRVFYEWEPDARLRSGGLIVERHEALSLGPFGAEVLI